MNNKQLLRQLIEQLLAIESAADMLNFLEGILTPAELEEIPTRLAIVQKLKQGIPQHKIAEELGVGVATVTRGSREIKRGKFQTVRVAKKGEGRGDND